MTDYNFTRAKNNLILIIVCYLMFSKKNTVHAKDLDEDVSSQTESSNSSRICSTQACLNAATDLSKSLDLTVQPCINFYKHVCGNFKKDIEFPKNRAQFDKYSALSDVIIGQIAKILDKNIDPQEPKTFQHIKTYYRSCLNTTSIEKRGLKPLQDIIKKLGGWPVVLGDAWQGENFTWEHADALLRSLGYSSRYIFRPYVMKDLDNPSKNILYIRVVDTRLKDLVHANNLMKAYLNYMIDVAVLLGANRDRATKELNETFTFEYNLVHAYQFADYLSPEMDVDYITIKEMQQSYPYVSWLEYLNNLTYPNYLIKETYKVRLENYVYLLGVKNILSNTTKRTLANYMIWRAIEDSMDYLNEEIRNTKLIFEKIRIGVSEPQSRETGCLDKMITRGAGFLPGISAMYVKHFFKNGTQDKVAKIVSDVHDRYKEILQNNSWLDENTKRSMLKKHKLMRKVIGYPKQLLDIDFLDKYYKDLHFEQNDYFKNAMVLNNFTYGNSIKELTQSPEENFWIDVGVAANVLIYYHKLFNAIVLPAAILQYPFFDENQPNFINYGSIGLFVGHEITHAYTLEDRPSDENGSFSSWWTESDQFTFIEKTQCYVNHYNNFTLDANRSFKLGLGENMADNEGFIVAFNAYKIWKDEHSNEPRLPSLNYTKEQLFWISAASTLCIRRREENKKLQLYTDEHATEELRINGAVSNIPDFARAFKCPVGTPMNPKQKCTYF